MKLCCTFVILITGLTAIAQEAGKIKELLFLTGDWSVEVEARLSMQGPWESSRGKSVIKFTLDSTLIEEEFTGSRQGKPFLAKTFFAVNNMNNNFQRTFIDSPHGVLVDFEGARSGDSLIFDKNFQYANGNVVKLRVVYKVLSNEEVVVSSMRMAQNSTAWDVNGRMKYHRLK